MSTAGIASLALFTPMVASNAIFSARRASRGVDAIDENPAYALANIDIAGAQILKGGRAAKALALATGPSLASETQSAAETIKNSSKLSKLANGASKVLNFTADHINPVICVASGIKVLGSDDKVDTAARESLALTTMFTAEAAAKDFIGMPFIEKINGKNIAKEREASFKKLFSEKQLGAIQDFCLTKKYCKYLPGALKGLFFVGASIGGYKLGEHLGDTILGKRINSAKA